jgi:hypothetical protein
MNFKKILTYAQAKKEIENNHIVYKSLYILQGLTARKVAENQNIHYDNNFQKAMCRAFPKKMGLGGKRPGSGNKKGVKLPKKNTTNCQTGKQPV